MKDRFDLITTDFTYIRWLGDRKGVEEKTTTWDKVIVDRQGDLSEWPSLLKKVQERRIMILAFANNHYQLCRRRHKAYAASRIMPNPLMSSTPFPLHFPVFLRTLILD